MHSRFHLINSGLYPETLPPCFVSTDAKRAFYGLVSELDNQRFYERRTDVCPYNATKHDGNRRDFATPNIISYFHVSTFIHKKWRSFERGFERSPYAIGAPKLMEPGSERAVKVASLSELSRKASENLGHAPFVLRADIAKCFSSIYTHSIPWAVHGVEASKADTDKRSAGNPFNALDFFVRNGQRGETLGVPIGPDAHRLIAELVLSRVDADLEQVVGKAIIGAVRHVDDYYIGLRSEHDAQSVLSHLRETLAAYRLDLNDHKTAIQSSLEPINDLWAQRLREHVRLPEFGHSLDRIERAISEAVETANQVGSDSPIKILLRSFDDARLYARYEWETSEHYLQRIVQKHPHAIDYACLLVAKRKAIGGTIDEEGWMAVADSVVGRALALNHHHEAIWMTWLLLACRIQLPAAMVEALARSRNGHIRALLAQAYVDGLLDRKPKLALGSGLATTDTNWLIHLVARSQGFTKASFSGDYATEFDHLAKRSIKLVDFNAHKSAIEETTKGAISRDRYGYDSDVEDGPETDEHWPFG
ncbi:RNA-directed DNA polymerase [Sulfitobacter sp. W002]|uniref:RNA-directed DNA polymerase n=1 Tax=Sulfitobacter sp. W002 TaxID=2867024 RepID=UPI0021A58E32|nr:RNA-directed DNA polymerase [Sulfitobacter sp. W002]UWR29658.1 RNA-directed DNA polymerase [Sulfitobacter sp. W002]